MIPGTRSLGTSILAAVLVGSVCTAGCTSNESAGDKRAAASAPLSGRVTIDGSSTVLPVSKAVGEAFQKANPGVQVSVEASGTGGGFKKFCAGGLDITGASRPINATEAAECRSGRIDFIELPVAFDSLSVVVNASNSFVECLTVPELKKMWEPGAEGKITRWNQIRSSFPDRPLTLLGPGRDSGTFDYFTLAVVGTESSSRNDYTKSEDDQVIAAGVEGDPNALAYFGYAYYLEHKDTLKLVSIDGGNGCVVASPQTVADATYQPLSRPIFAYINTASAARPEVKALAEFYVAPENAEDIRAIGYVPLPTATLLAMSRRLTTGVTGSVFGGSGSVIGVTVDDLQAEDRLRNALVR